MKKISELLFLKNENVTIIYKKYMTEKLNKLFLFFPVLYGLIYGLSLIIKNRYVYNGSFKFLNSKLLFIYFIKGIGFGSLFLLLHLPIISLFLYCFGKFLKGKLSFKKCLKLNIIFSSFLIFPSIVFLFEIFYKIILIFLRKIYLNYQSIKILSSIFLLFELIVMLGIVYYLFSSYIKFLKEGQNFNKIKAITNSLLSYFFLILTQIFIITKILNLIKVFLFGTQF